MSTGSAEAPGALRLFVALNFADALRARLHDAAAPLRELLGDAASWPPAPALHLTLRFVGAQPPALVAPLTDALHAAAAGAEPLTLVTTTAGAFPSLTRPRVLWIGLAAHPTLTRLHARVDDACAAIGLGREERAFHPHVTVGRMRPYAPGRRRAAAPESLQAVAALRPELHLPVATLDLMHSQLTPAGARHTRLAALPLGAPAAAEAR
jgi:2'-5' RNA ligase